MPLFFKKMHEKEVSLKNCFIFNEESLHVLKWVYGSDLYPHQYCLEANIIQEICKNKEGLFDFKKGMIDIGAAVGEYCVCLPFSKNYVFEPNKNLMWVCHTNLLNADKVDISETYNVALSDKDGVEQIFTNGVDKYFDVNCKTLDSYNFKNIGFIKIDVEGFEEKVIRGGLLTIISNNYPPILFECWKGGFSYFGKIFPQEKRDSLFNLLKTLGYEIFEEYCNTTDTHLAVHKTQL